jgi:hypothetical protein
MEMGVEREAASTALAWRNEMEKQLDNNKCGNIQE